MPRGAALAVPPYSEESGPVEYQVLAPHHRGQLSTGSRSSKGSSKRRHRRNPWNEFECGATTSRYSSYGLLLALSGFTLTKGNASFAQRYTPATSRRFGLLTALGNLLQRGRQRTRIRLKFIRPAASQRTRGHARESANPEDPLPKTESRQAGRNVILDNLSPAMHRRHVYKRTRFRAGRSLP